MTGPTRPNMKIVGTFYHVETPQDAAAEVIREQNAWGHEWPTVHLHGSSLHRAVDLLDRHHLIQPSSGDRAFCFHRIADLGTDLGNLTWYYKDDLRDRLRALAKAPP